MKANYKRRQYRLRRITRGVCITCSKRCWRYRTAKGVEKQSQFCIAHLEKHRERQRVKKGSTRRFPPKLPIDAAIIAQDAVELLQNLVTMRKTLLAKINEVDLRIQVTLAELTQMTVAAIARSEGRPVTGR